MTEQEKIDDFQKRAGKAKGEIDEILKKYEVTIAPINQYQPQGISTTCELCNLKKFPEEKSGEEKKIQDVGDIEEATIIEKK
jgi:hypothetical protein